MMTFEPILDPFGPAVPVAAAAEPGPVEMALEPTEPHPEAAASRALDAEQALTGALAALQQKRTRVASALTTTAGAARAVFGVVLAVGIGAIFVYAAVRASRPRRRPSVVRTVARSIGREVGSRLLLAAATTAGVRLVEGVVVPVLVAAISARQNDRDPRAATAGRVKATSKARPKAKSKASVG